MALSGTIERRRTLTSTATKPFSPLSKHGPAFLRGEWKCVLAEQRMRSGPSQNDFNRFLFSFFIKQLCFWAFEIFFKTWFLIGSGSNRIKDNSSSTIGTFWMIPDGVYRQGDSGSRDLRWRKLVWMKCNAWNNMQLVITCLLVILVATHDNSLLQAMYMQLVLAVQHMK